MYDITVNNLTEKEISGISYFTSEEGAVASIHLSLFRNFNNQIQRAAAFTITNGSNAVVSTVQKVGTTINPLASGDFYKIKIDKSGVFKITSQFLQSIGINPSSVNPKNFRIYGNGGIMLSEFNQDTKYDALQENAIQVFADSSV